MYLLGVTCVNVSCWSVTCTYLIPVNCWSVPKYLPGLGLFLARFQIWYLSFTGSTYLLNYAYFPNQVTQVTSSDVHIC
jgi:hypothetical protein